jgi:sulfide:quinone oxidoreductase
MPAQHNVVILGGSFAGLTAAFDLKRKLRNRVHVSVVSRTDKFWFIPSLIWVPFGRKKGDEISLDLKPVLERKGIRFLHEAAIKILPEEHTVITEHRELLYDHLIIATGPAYNFEIIPGLGPKDGYTHSVCNIKEAEEAKKAWEEFLKDPGDIVVGGTQFASCFGAAYDVIFNIEHALRKAKIRKRVNVTYITAEPFLSHFGIGGMWGAKPMIDAFFKLRGIKSITNAVIQEVKPGEVVLKNGRRVPFKYGIIIPPFLGADAVRNSDGIGNEKGFVEVDEYYRHKRYPNIFAAGVAAVVPTPGPTPVPIGVPKTGYMSEVMARYAVKNIIADVTGGVHKPKPFQNITPLCIMDAGDMEVLIVGTNMFPPRKFNALIPNPFGDWAKRLFEPFYLWKMRTGRTWLP